MPGISINVVLSRMQQTVDADGQPVNFTLEFVKDDGSIRFIKAQKHVKYHSFEPGKNENSKFKYNLKNKGSILLYDMELKEYRTVKIDSILKYNNIDVIH